MREEKLRVRKIKVGTVIDHIPSGRAMTVLEILGITQGTDATVSVLMNAPSGKYESKDVVKIEGRKLDEEEVNKIALTAPEATINVIEDYKVVEKNPVKLPERVEEVVNCSNPACITNTKEPVDTIFKVVNKTPLKLRCSYCERITEEKELLDQFRSR